MKNSSVCLSVCVSSKNVRLFKPVNCIGVIVIQKINQCKQTAVILCVLCLMSFIHRTPKSGILWNN